MSSNKKELLFPFLLECCEHTDDEFWKDLFENLAYGICPYGTYLSKNFLCCSFKGKEFNYKLIRKESEILFEEIYDLLKNKLGITSLKEKLENKKLVNNFETLNEDYKNNWNMIRKKNIKDGLFLNFAIEKQKEFNLTTNETKYLLSIIRLFVIYKIISSKDIEYEDGKIISIKNIDFENRKVLVDENLLNKTKENKEDIIFEDEKIKPSKHWEKYINQLSK